MDFTSFVLERSKRENIKRIILFGSVARSECDEESDVDIFVDVFDDNAAKKELEKIKSEYLKSKRYEDYWLLKDVKNARLLKDIPLGVKPTISLKTLSLFTPKVL